MINSKRALRSSLPASVMTRLLLCALLFTSSRTPVLASSPENYETNLNSLMDLIFDSVEDELRLGFEAGLATKVPNVNKSWRKGIGALGLTASLNCTGGRLASLKNISRDGDVVLRKDGGTVSLRTPLTMEQLTVHYDRCQVKVRSSRLFPKDIPVGQQSALFIINGTSFGYCFSQFLVDMWHR